jgi:hypothetical protein
MFLLSGAGGFSLEEAFTGREGIEVTGLRALSISSNARARANGWRREGREKPGQRGSQSQNWGCDS